MKKYIFCWIKKKFDNFYIKRYKDWSPIKGFPPLLRFFFQQGFIWEIDCSKKKIFFVKKNFSNTFEHSAMVFIKIKKNFFFKFFQKKKFFFFEKSISQINPCWKKNLNRGPVLSQIYHPKPFVFEKLAEGGLIWRYPLIY